MKIRLLIAMLTVGGFGLAYNPPAHAVGCITGGVAGAVAGHMAHHGVLGAVGGCIAGHELHKHSQRTAARQQQQQGMMPQQHGYDTNNAPADQRPDTSRNTE